MSHSPDATQSLQELLLQCGFEIYFQSDISGARQWIADEGEIVKLMESLRSETVRLTEVVCGPKGEPASGYCAINGCALMSGHAKLSERSAIATISLSGCAPRLYGSGGVMGNVGPFGLQIHVDPNMPDDTMEFRDSVSGRLLGKIVNVGRA